MINVYTDTDKTTHTVCDGVETFDFGTVPKNFDTSVDVLFKGVNIKITETKSTCGCTIAEPCKINDNLSSVKVTYKDSHKQRPFAKTVKVTLLQNGTTIDKNIKIKGIIT